MQLCVLTQTYRAKCPVCGRSVRSVDRRCKMEEWLQRHRHCPEWAHLTPDSFEWRLDPLTREISRAVSQFPQVVQQELRIIQQEQGSSAHIAPLTDHHSTSHTQSATQLRHDQQPACHPNNGGPVPLHTSRTAFLTASGNVSTLPAAHSVPCHTHSAASGSHLPGNMQAPAQCMLACQQSTPAATSSPGSSRKPFKRLKLANKKALPNTTTTSQQLPSRCSGSSSPLLHTPLPGPAGQHHTAAGAGGGIGALPAAMSEPHSNPADGLQQEDSHGSLFGCSLFNGWDSDATARPDVLLDCGLQPDSSHAAGAAAAVSHGLGQYADKHDVVTDIAPAAVAAGVLQAAAVDVVSTAVDDVSTALNDVSAAAAAAPCTALEEELCGVMQQVLSEADLLAMANIPWWCWSQGYSCYCRPHQGQAGHKN